MRLLIAATLAATLAGCSFIDDMLPHQPLSARQGAKPGTVVGAVVFKPVAGETTADAVLMASRACAEYGMQAEPGARNDKGATAELRYSCQ